MESEDRDIRPDEHALPRSTVQTYSEPVDALGDSRSSYSAIDDLLTVPRPSYSAIDDLLADPRPYLLGNRLPTRLPEIGPPGV